ncbi:MAG: sugar ABC transporter substrate-binding protein [Mycetocola sp.]
MITRTHRGTTRTLSALALAASAALVLSSCSGGGDGGNTSDGGEVTSLSVLDYYSNEPDKQLVQDLIDACATELNVTIDREVVPGKDLIQKVLQKSSSKTLPDVLMLDNPDVQEIAATGGLSPLGDYGITGDGFIQGFVDAGTREGELYGLGPAANTLGLFYNKTLLEEAGIEPPTTWDELKDASAKLTDGDRYGIAFSSIATYEGSWQFLPFLWTNGGDETDLTSPAVAEAVELWVDLVDDGSASSSVLTWSQADVKDQFATGKAAMMVNGPWQFASLADSDIEYGTVQIPINEAGQTPTAPLGGELWTVPRTGDEARQAKAAEFVQCLTAEDKQLDYAKGRGIVPSRTALAEQYMEEVPEMAAFTEQVQNARARTGKLGEEWPDVATEIYTGLQNAITGKVDPADTCK